MFPLSQQPISRFNSRTHAGCDEIYMFCSPCSTFVSIHAPMQGATLYHYHFHVLIEGFNSRTHAGCDLQLFFLVGYVLRFQFTHPCRVRHCFLQYIKGCITFQFTHPCRVRQICLICLSCISVFQFTHPCRVRHYNITLCGLRQLFQFTHPCRVRHVQDGLNAVKSGFNSRTHAAC